jgi:hypothetical protein
LRIAPAIKRILSGGLPAAVTVTPPIARERISLKHDWRFTHGEPAGVDSRTLLYDARPEDKQEDGTPRPGEDTSDAQKLDLTGRHHRACLAADRHRKERQHAPQPPDEFREARRAVPRRGGLHQLE